MSAMLDPTFDALIEKRGQAPGATAQAFGGKVTGAEAGALLAFMASQGARPVRPRAPAARRPAAARRAQHRRTSSASSASTATTSGVGLHARGDPPGAVHGRAVAARPPHRARRASLAVDLAPDPERLQEIAGRVAEKLPDLFREGSAGLADLFTTPEQREKLAGLTAVMSLLEGHADVVMDDVGPAHIPTVAAHPARFTERRKGAGAPRPAAAPAARPRGQDAPVPRRRRLRARRQDRVGVEGFNAVWSSPDTLPLAREIEEPEAWVRRVHG